MTAATHALPATPYRPAELVKRTIRLVPGIALLAALGYLGKLVENAILGYGKAHHLAVPDIEYVLWAILFGLIITNTVGVPAIFKPGVASYEFWLKLGIVLLGARFLLGDVVRLGGVSLILALVELVSAIAIVTLIGRWFRLSPC